MSLEAPRHPEELGLPHREPFRFVDWVLELEPGESARCTKTFAPEDPVFRGHFPDRPLVPGVLLAEALAQTAGLAAGRAGRPMLLSSIRGMKFPASALPGETITLRARRLMTVGALWQFETTADVGGRVVAEGQVVLSEGS
ncbi:MAG TPA: 3-hydroxyacyl-ACP dehydratase FabZ family protein [Chthoniobacteraceae bacterium]|nr:3-hydroxyacyl-ACP dehydratase FabZ family protein [Chthoniobacteraceae bacterium]